MVVAAVAMDGVVACSAVDDVISGAAVDHVVTRVAGNDVDARPPGDRIASAFAVDIVGSTATLYGIVPGACEDADKIGYTRVHGNVVVAPFAVDDDALDHALRERRYLAVNFHLEQRRRCRIVLSWRLGNRLHLDVVVALRAVDDHVSVVIAGG